MSEGNGFVTRDLFIRKAPRRYREIQVPDFGKVRIQSLTEAEKAAYESSHVGRKGINREKMLELRRRLIVLCVVDAEGSRVLQESDLDALRHLDGGPASMIFAACRDHCGFDKDDELEELKKSSPEMSAASLQ